MAEPLTVETRDVALVYNAVRAEWYEAWQAVFRPSALAAVINIATAATHIIISGVVNKRIKIVSLFFTVAGEVNIILKDGVTAISGPMDFGGTSEPRGIVIPFPFSPLELSVGNAFEINLSAAIQVSGTVCYYYQ